MKKFAFLLILIALTVGMAQQPQNQGASNLEESECYDCHQMGGTGGGRSSLQKMFTVQVEEGLFVKTGEAFDFNVTVQNTWWAEQYDIHAELDVSRVSVLSFASNIAPTADSGGASIPGATFEDREAKSATTTFDVPLGATDFIFHVEHEQSGAEAAELEAELWYPGADTDGPASQALTLPTDFVIRGSQTIADSAGTYTVKITRPGLLDSPLDLEQMEAVQEDQSIRTQWGAWYNVTDQPSQFFASPDILDGQDDDGINATTFTWKLYAEELPKEGQSVDVNVQLTAHYQHATAQSQWNTWRYAKSISFPFTFPEPEEGGVPADGFVIGNSENETAPDVLVESATIPLSTYGEILGYTGAFLVVSSLVTGGILGRPMKWFCNLFFRKARNRIAYHNFTSHMLLFVALAHLGLFLYETQYHWTIGVLFGGSSILLMLILALTGIFQIPMIRKIKYGGWKFFHYTAALLLIFTVAAHMLLDGPNYEWAFEWAESNYGWQDPIREMWGPEAPDVPTLPQTDS